MNPEPIIKILWRHLRPFVAAAYFDEVDGAIQAAAEEISEALKVDNE